MKMLKLLNVNTNRLKPMERHLANPPFNPPKSRAGKLIKFKHYQTDAPV